uniref:Uncharacterized protein n=1 Tax=Setaria italica TaxID=4555 RepID=K3ZPI8_SETIT
MLLLRPNKWARSRVRINGSSLSHSSNQHYKK